MTVYELWDWLLVHGSDTDEVYIGEVGKGMGLKIAKPGDDFATHAIEMEVGA